MHDYIPDILERGEARCEAWETENVCGGIAKCACGRTFDIDDGETCSADPFAIPVCPTCFMEWTGDKSPLKQGERPC